jgi:hypothetical protein
MPQKPNNERHLVDWILAALGIILAILLFSLVRQYQTLRRENTPTLRQLWPINTPRNNVSRLAPNNADFIRSWMTFDYVDKLFDLPPDYLKAKLSISDAAYPKITINKFAKDIRQNSSSTLVEVQNAVRQYSVSPAPVANVSST